MHKTIKLQYGGTFYNGQWIPGVLSQNIQNNLSFSDNIKRFQSMGFDMTGAAKAAASVSPGITPPKSLISSVSGTTPVAATGPSAASQAGLEMLGQLPQVTDSLITGFGGRKADMNAGEAAVMGLVGNVSGTLLKSGNPALMGIGAAGLLGKSLMEYAGPTAKKQATAGMTATGYDMDNSLGANTKKLAWFGNTAKVKKINDQTAKTDYSNLMKYQTSNVALQNMQAGIQNVGNVTNKNYNQLTGVSFAKKGGTINPAILRNITSKVKVKTPEIVYKIVEIEEEVPKFENGGTLKNVIPDGALHARKHNLGGDIAEFITDKGIPVITIAEAGEEIVNDDGKKILAEGGEITQHAEIERDEIIFSKPTTDQLEEYFKQYSESDSDEEKNRILLECGRFLASEILENTIDNTGIINETVVK